MAMGWRWDGWGGRGGEILVGGILGEIGVRVVGEFCEGLRVDCTCVVDVK